jgi:hypothetical protein
MARIKIDEIVKHLGFEFKSTLKKTVKAQFPEKEFDDRELFIKFVDTLSGECKKWEVVPDNFVEKGDY